MRPKYWKIRVKLSVVRTFRYPSESSWLNATRIFKAEGHTVLTISPEGNYEIVGGYANG